MLGEEDSKDNLVAFLNAVLDPEDKKKLVSLEIVDNKQLTKELIEDKTGRLDVRAKTADGTQVNIEVQLTNQYNMEKRTLFYWGKLFLDGIKQGDDYINLQKVITINILEFDFLDLEKFHSKFHLWEDEDKEYMLT
ncbi:MAG: Rpn family recombination-promoting nuclease/putative transposase, partial [Bacillota bacterium]